MAKMAPGIQIVLVLFVLFLLVSVISSFMLIRIKKMEYPAIWEEDKSKARFWRTPEQHVLHETAYNKPQWLKENTSATRWLLIYRLSFLIAMLLLSLPFILALFGVYLFD